MRYVGIQSQQETNNIKSIALLALFPLIILAAVWMAIAIFATVFSLDDLSQIPWEWVNETFLAALPWALAFVVIWFVIAYFWHSSIIQSSTGAVPLERRYGMRVYNITENLCMRVGMNMPKLYIVNDPAPNAFASGINEKTYAVTVTTGLLNVLDDRELAGVIAHELTHIRNRDTRLLITSIVFVGIVSILMNIAVRLTISIARSNSYSRSKNNNAGAGILIGLIAIACLAVAWFFTSVTRFAISRKREYMADAGGAELCGEPWALASALRKIAYEPGLEKANKDVAALFIARPGRRKKPSWWNQMWATHPDIGHRIAILEQF